MAPDPADPADPAETRAGRRQLELVVTISLALRRQEPQLEAELYLSTVHHLGHVCYVVQPSIFDFFLTKLRREALETGAVICSRELFVEVCTSSSNSGGTILSEDMFGNMCFACYMRLTVNESKVACLRRQSSRPPAERGSLACAGR